MTRAVPASAPWWTLPPVRQVSHLTGVDPELLSIALDPLPAAAPAVIQVRPAPIDDPLTFLLDELDRAAVALFPHWLPGAERLDGSHALSVSAVRVLATEVAAKSHNFAPFLVDLAERALSGRAGGRSRFAAEVRAAGLGRVIADAYGRDSAALLIVVPDGLAPAGERALVAAAELLAQHGRLSVWLAGAPLHAVDRVRSIPIVLPGYLTQLLVEADEAVGAVVVPELTYPPLSGLPRKDSPAEQALERALTPHEWAAGRRWNHTYEWHLLGKAYRLDLFWAADGLVVEVDGDDHRGRLKFADDRRRDVQLQLRGCDVLRFTNDQVLSDVDATVLKIQRLLIQRRAPEAHHTEKRHHAEH